jgi:type II secretory ATPase GspE/PulE/Tfp pilus assembly ATPase PilB-like protein
MFKKFQALLVPAKKSVYGATLMVNSDVAGLVPRPIAMEYRFVLRDLVRENGKFTLYVAIPDSQTEEYRRKLSELFGEVPFRKKLMGEEYNLELQVVFETYPVIQIDSQINQIYHQQANLSTVTGRQGIASIPREAAENYRVLVESFSGHQFQVLYCDSQGLQFFKLSFDKSPFRQTLCRAFGIQDSAGLKYESRRVSPEQFQLVFDRLYPGPAPSLHDSTVKNRATQAQRNISALYDSPDSTESGFGESDVDRLIDLIFVPAYKNDVQDVKLRYSHAKQAITIEWIVNDTQVFPDGIAGPESLFSIVMNRLALRARIQDPVSSNARRGDIQFSYKENGVTHEFSGRLLSLPRYNSEAPMDQRNKGFFYTIRLIRPGGKRRSITQLGLYPHELEAFDFARGQRSGMVINCGQPGTGKNETIQANLDALRDENDGAVRGITFERPIEAILEGYDQIGFPDDLVTIGGVEVRRDGAYYLSGAMQASPRVIYINEINSKETAYLAFTAEQSGSLVWSTTHSKDPFSAIDRFRGLGIASDVIAGSILMIVHQTLPQTICPKCRVRDTNWRGRIKTTKFAPNLIFFEEALKFWFASDANGPPTDQDIDRLFQPMIGSGRLPSGEACPNCRIVTPRGTFSTGLQGRTLVPEIWIPGPQQSQIIENVNSARMRRTAVLRGHRTLWFNALQRIADGILSIDAAAQACGALDPYMEGMGEFDPADPGRAAPIINHPPRIQRVTVRHTDDDDVVIVARQLPDTHSEH